MALLHKWNIFMFLLTTEVGTGITVIGHEKDIMHAIVGRSLLIRTWQFNSSYMFITVKKGNNTLLDTLMSPYIGRHKEVQNGRMKLKYNHTLEQVVLMFENISKEDGGLYEMDERLHKTLANSYNIEAEAHERQDGRWGLEINVLGPDEVKQGCVGEYIIMEFENLTNQSTLYNYDEIVAHFVGSSCSVLTDSYLYGRLRCASDESRKMYTITISNVSQRDSGLYKVATGRDETGRFFLNIQDQLYAGPGDNVTIGWFYNQQGCERSLRVIHPNQGVMILLPITNVPRVKSNFQHRLLYSGEATKSFMSFTLISLRKSDEGLYTIETLHGTRIPGSKELIVEDIATGSTASTTTLVSSYTKVLHYAKTNILYGELTTERAGQNTITMSNDGASTLGTVSVPIYLIPVIVVAVGVINLMVCYFIRIRRKSTCNMEPDRPHVHEEFDTSLYLTPNGEQILLSIQSTNGGLVAHSSIAQNVPFVSSMGLLHRTQSTCTDGYELVNISSNDDSKSILNDNENIYESSENSKTTQENSSGYLTVLGVLESYV